VAKDAKNIRKSMTWKFCKVLLKANCTDWWFEWNHASHFKML